MPETGDGLSKAVMKRDRSRLKITRELRLRAEKAIPKTIDSAKEMSADEVRRLAHELEVHQVELEMQNEEQRRSQIEISESRKKYRDLYDFAPVGYFSLDKEGKIIEVNLTGATLLGATRSHLMKVPFTRYIAPEHRGLFSSYLLKLFEDGPNTCDLKLIKKDGSSFYASAQGATVGPAVQISTVDITKRMEAERALRESEQRYRQLSEENARLLEQAQQDAQTKTTLLHEVNHRVKNNLAGIIGLIQTQEHFCRTEESGACWFMCKDLAGRIQGLAMVHNLLSAAGWSSVKLADLATEVVQSAVRNLPPDQRVSVDVSPSSIQVSPDQANALALVINELATNTIKHGQATSISVRIEENGGQISLEYQDNGSGYPESILEEDRYNVGLNLVTNLVRRELRGEVTLCNVHGAVTRIQLGYPRP